MYVCLCSARGMFNVCNVVHVVFVMCLCVSLCVRVYVCLRGLVCGFFYVELDVFVTLSVCLYVYCVACIGSLYVFVLVFLFACIL